MKNRGGFKGLTVVAVALLAGCAGQATKTEPVPPMKIVDAENAEGLDAALADAARGYTRVKENGVTLFCKRYRQTGSNLTTTNCITEAQLREQLENARKFGEDRRQQGRRCASGPGCQAG